MAFTRTPTQSSGFINGKEMIDYDAILFEPVEFAPLKPMPKGDPSDCVVANVACFTRDALNGTVEPKVITNADIRSKVVVASLRITLNNGDMQVSKVEPVKNYFNIVDVDDTTFEQVVKWAESHPGWNQRSTTATGGDAPWEAKNEDQPDDNLPPF